VALVEAITDHQIQYLLTIDSRVEIEVEGVEVVEVLMVSQISIVACPLPIFLPNLFNASDWEEDTYFCRRVHPVVAGTLQA
jgi:hypothetical protein